MKLQRSIFGVVLVLVISTGVFGQRGEVAITLNESFLDALFDAVYQNAPPLEFPLASAGQPQPRTQGDAGFGASALTVASSCSETIRLLREISGVRTAVRFRDGKIYAPIAFSGSYNPPLIGCINFAGYAESNIELEFDQASQRLLARAKVLNVSLNGTGGVGGTVIARMVQSSIDRKINPVEILKLDKLSFVLPVQNSSALKMRAVGIRHEVTNGALIVHVAYEFVKA